MAQRASRGIYSFTVSLTLPPRVGGWSTPCPWRFIPRNCTRCPLHKRLGGPRVWSAQVQKILAPPGFDPRTVQPVARPATIYLPTVLWVVLGDGRSVDLAVTSIPSVGSAPDLTRGHGCSLFFPFGRHLTTRWACPLSYLSYTVKPVLNGTWT